MSPAEFKTLREYLNLPLQWVADQVGVRLRTAQYWEAGGRMQVPEDVAELLLSIEQRLDRELEALLSSVNAQGKAEAVILLRYRTDEALWEALPAWRPLPASTHGAFLALCRRTLKARGSEAVLRYEDEA